MRISARMALQSTVLVALAVTIRVPDAAAGAITVSFSGTVKSELPNDSYPGTVTTNDPITSSSSFSFNTAFATGGPITTNGKYTFTSTASGQGLGLFVNTSPSTPVLWSDAYSGPSSSAVYYIQMSTSTSGPPTTMLDLHISTLGGSAEAGPKTSAAVDIFFTSTTYSGGKNLPTTSATLQWDPPGDPGQGFTSTINNFIINGQAVPEPSSFVLMGVAAATGGIGLVISRRKLARAL
jgi:hypothetical protein